MVLICISDSLPSHSHLRTASQLAQEKKTIMVSTEHFLKTSGDRCTFRLIMILEVIGETAMAKDELPTTRFQKR